MLKSIFDKTKVVIGMVHLLPLPGSPQTVDLNTVLQQALADAKALESGGVDALLIENFGDLPYYPDQVGVETVAAMTFIVSKIVEQTPLPFGINVLRNDSIAALSITSVCGGRFIRANILTGVYITDQGIIKGQAYRTLRYRTFLNSKVFIFADIHVKHAISILKEDNNNIVEFYPLKQGIAWVVPENKKMVRVGIAVKENISNNYNHFIIKRFGKDYRNRIESQQAGLIPIYNPNLTTQKQNIFLVGDAATQVKATTLGGIVPGLMASKALTKSIKNYGSYERNWKKAIGKELWLHLTIRKVLDGFSKKDYNKLINICKNKKIKNLLKKYDRDFPSKFLLKMVLTEPRMIYFGKYFYRLF